MLTLSYDEPDKPLRLCLIDCSYGLPAQFARYYKDRPDYMIPGGIGDATLVTAAYMLPSPIATPTPVASPSSRPQPGPSAPPGGSESPSASSSPTPEPAPSEVGLPPTPAMSAQRPPMVPVL